MPPDNRKNGDIEIIPPDHSRGQKQQRERIYISFGADGASLQNLPWHQRLIYALAGLAGAILIGLIVFLVLASTLLIWIPLILAATVVIAVAVFVRARFLRR